MSVAGDLRVILRLLETLVKKVEALERSNSPVSERDRLPEKP